MREAPPAEFLYDVSSPYAYLAALRVNEVLGAPVRWQPIAFGALLREIGKLPWSLRPETRAAGMAAVERRARARGLPSVRWPPGWPDRSYSVRPLRALLYAEEQGRQQALALALYRTAFVDGRALDTPAAVAEAARSCGLDPDAVLDGAERADLKARLRQNTERAVARGVTGVPTVAVEGRLFWGDDQLEAAAEALAGTAPYTGAP